MTIKCFFVLIALIFLILKFYPLFRVNFLYWGVIIPFSLFPFFASQVRVGLQSAGELIRLSRTRANEVHTAGA